MSIRITTETMSHAPADARSEAALSRRNLGVGETVILRANRRVRWSGRGIISTGSRGNSTATRFLQPGRHVVTASHGAQSERVEFNVHKPSVRVDRERLVNVTSPFLGAHMVLRFVLTPLSVSFAHLEFREVPGGADRIWGYFSTNRSHFPRTLRHDATLDWTGVAEDNRLSEPDNAAFAIHPRDMVWPIVAGGFRWNIPDEYRIRGEEETHRFDNLMPQSIRIDPSSETERASFSGTVSVNKGTHQVVATYRNSRFVSQRWSSGASR